MKNSRTLLGGIVHFLHFDTQAPQVGLSLLDVEKERPAIMQPHQGIKHGALNRRSQTFITVPIAPGDFADVPTRRLVVNTLNIKSSLLTG